MTEVRRTHRLPSTWVQMAIIPTNSDSDASAAASWITVLNMAFSPERRENIVHVMFLSQVSSSFNHSDLTRYKKAAKWATFLVGLRGISLALIHFHDRAVPQS